MKALVKKSPAPGFVLADVAVPAIRDDEVLIRVRRAGVCGTDVHIHDWDAWASGRCTPPFTVGHEFAGEVTAVGQLVTEVKAGNRVTAEGHIVCGRCHLCRTGNAHVCPNTKIIGVDRDGCFAEYIAMPATNVWHLDDDIGFDVGSIHDPMGNAFHTALHGTEIPGATVLVTDGGPGFPPEELPRVFETFFRGSNARGQQSGYGLGLSLARRVAVAHGGSITAQNAAGGGARIELRLPGAKGEPATAGAAAT